MKAILFGALLGVLLVLWPAAVPLAAAAVASLAAQPTVLAFVLGVLARPALPGRWPGE